MPGRSWKNIYTMPYCALNKNNQEKNNKFEKLTEFEK